MLAPKKVEATKGTLITSAVERSLTWGSIEAAHGLQEVLAQAVDGDYGIVHRILPIQRRCPAFESGGYFLPA